MQLKLHLHSDRRQVIPINYQYPLSAVIYKILDRADQSYAQFLHESGYTKNGSLKGFKFFTYSDIQSPFLIAGDRLHFLTNEAALTVSFYLPKAIETFIKGLFLNQHIKIADHKSQGKFIIATVEILPQLKIIEKQELLLKPISPVVCGKKNHKGNYDFLAPDHAEFTSQLLYNWKEKIKATYERDDIETKFSDATIQVIYFKNPPKSRLITIKEGTPAETKIRGFTNFKLKVTGKQDMIELLIFSGVGIYNSLGMGCVEII